MNDYAKWERLAEQYRKTHPPGTRLVLLSTSEVAQPIPIGMRGTVDHIDDQCNNGKFRIMLSKIKTPPFSLYNQLIYFS